MTGWTDVFLGVIAVATLLMAIVQVGVIVAAGRLARRLDRIASQVEQDLKPIFGQLNAIGRDAARAASLATQQVERADRLFSDVAQRIEETVSIVQQNIIAPVREGQALLSGLRAALGALGQMRTGGRRQPRSEDDDALFI